MTIGDESQQLQSFRNNAGQGTHPDVRIGPTPMPGPRPDPHRSRVKNPAAGLPGPWLPSYARPMFRSEGGPDGHDISTDLPDLAPHQVSQLRGRLDGEGIQARWTGNRLTIDSAYEDRVTTLVDEVRGAAGPAASAAGPATAPGAPYAAGPANAYGAVPPAAAYPAPYPAATPSTYPSAYPSATPAYGYGYVAAPRTNSNAIASLVLGIAAWALCPVVPAIIGVVLGNKSKREIAASGGTETGEGLATAGLIVSWLNIGLYGLLIVGFLILVVAAAVSS